MNKYTVPVLLLFLITPNIASAANPVITYIIQQLNQLNAAVEQLNDSVATNVDDIQTNEINIGINVSDITTNVDGISSNMADINELLSRVSALESQQATPVLKVFLGDVLLGYRVSVGDTVIYEPTSGFYYSFDTIAGFGTSTYVIRQKDIEYESSDCSGQGLLNAGRDSDTADILVRNGDSTYYRATGAYPVRPIIIASRRIALTGECQVTSNDLTSFGVSMVEPVVYPLPYILPITALSASIRVVYEAP